MSKLGIKSYALLSRRVRGSYERTIADRVKSRLIALNQLSFRRATLGRPHRLHARSSRSARARTIFEIGPS